MSLCIQKREKEDQHRISRKGQRDIFLSRFLDEKGEGSNGAKLVKA